MLFTIALTAHAGPPPAPYVAAFDLDYADELSPGTFAIEATEDLGHGRQRVRIGLELTNLDGALFEEAVFVPALDPSLDARVVQDGRFDAIAPAGPGGAASSVEPLIVELPADRVGDLLDALETHADPFAVYAREVPQLHDDVTIYRLDASDDVAFDNARDFGLNETDPFGPPPYDPTQVVGLSMYFPASAPAELQIFDPRTDRMYLEPAEPLQLTSIHEGFHHFVVDEVTIVEVKGAGEMVTVTGRHASAEDLADIYAYAGFSSRDHTAIAPPGGATRIAELDGIVLDDELRDSHTWPIRFNGLDALSGSVRLSGQVHGQVLAPWIGVRLRPGERRLELGVRTDLTLAAELRAQATFEDEGEVPLYDLCFPLPDLVFGPVKVPMALSLGQQLTAAGRLRGDTAIGIHQRVQLAWEATCTDAGCTTDAVHAPSGPVEVTPPQIVHYATGFGQVGTRLQTELLFGAIYPVCQAPTSLSLSGEIHGRVDLDTRADPFWTAGYGGEIEGRATVGLFGFEAIDHRITRTEFGDDVRQARPLRPSPDLDVPWLSGEDQRWVAVLDQHDSPNRAIESVSTGALSDGSVAFAASEPGHLRVGMVDRFGSLLWNETYLSSGNRRPEALAVLPDDAVLVGGSFAFLAVHEPDGTVRWARDYDLSDGVDTARGVTLHDVGFVNTGGGWDPTSVGELARGTVREDDAVVIRFDADGEVVWARRYDSGGGEELHGVVTTTDGDLVAVGTLADGRGLAMRVDGDDGAVQWAVALQAAARGVRLWDVTEAADGSLFAVGEASRDIRRTGAAYVVRIAPDGSSAAAAILLHDLGSEAEQDFETAPVVQSSDTPYDALLGVVAAGDGVAVVGRAGLAERRTAWMARLTDDLGIGWMQVLDGPSGDGLHAVAVTDDGLVVAGTSQEPIAGQTDDHVVIAKVPFEGGLTLHPSFDAVVTRYLAPGVRDATSDPAVAPDGPLVPLTMTAADLVLDASTDVTSSLLAARIPECVTLLTETGRPTTTDPCPDVDLRRPTVRVLSGDDGPYSVADAWPLEVSVIDAGGIVDSEVLVDGVPTAAGATVELAALGVGPHAIEAWAEDTDGQRGEDEVRFEVIDDVPPEVTVRSPTPGTYALDEVVDVDVVVEDAHGAVGEVVVAIAGVPWPDARLPMAELGAGRHVLTVRALDDAGNEGVAEVTFSVERVADGGCGCATTDPPPVVLAGLLVLGLRRRRCARIATPGGTMVHPEDACGVGSP